MSFPRDKEELATVAVSSSVLLDQGRVKVEPFCKTWHVQDMPDGTRFSSSPPYNQEHQGASRYIRCVF